MRALVREGLDHNTKCNVSRDACQAIECIWMDLTIVVQRTQAALARVAVRWNNAVRSRHPIRPVCSARMVQGGSVDPAFRQL